MTGRDAADDGSHSQAAEERRCHQGFDGGRRQTCCEGGDGAGGSDMKRMTDHLDCSVKNAVTGLTTELHGRIKEWEL